MPLRTTGEYQIDFSTFPSSDGKPMAETEFNLDPAMDLIGTFQGVVSTRHHAGGNLPIYYNEDSGWEHISPDVFIALDAGRERRESWKTWKANFPRLSSRSSYRTPSGATCTKKWSYMEG